MTITRQFPFKIDETKEFQSFYAQINLITLRLKCCKGKPVKDFKGNRSHSDSQTIATRRVNILAHFNYNISLLFAIATHTISDFISLIKITQTNTISENEFDFLRPLEITINTLTNRLNTLRGEKKLLLFITHSELNKMKKIIVKPDKLW